MDPLTGSSGVAPGRVDYGFDGPFWGWSYAIPLAALILIAVTRLLIARRFVLLVAAILRSPDTARKIGEWGDRAVAWAYGLFKKTPDFSVVDEVLKFRSSTVDVVSQGWLRITGTSYLQQFMQFMILWAAIFAIQGGSNAPVTFLEAFAAFAFGRLTTFIPLPPGGLGTTGAAPHLDERRQVDTEDVREHERLTGLQASAARFDQLAPLRAGQRLGVQRRAGRGLRVSVRCGHCKRRHAQVGLGFSVTYSVA